MLPQADQREVKSQQNHNESKIKKNKNDYNICFPILLYIVGNVNFDMDEQKNFLYP